MKWFDRSGEIKGRESLGEHQVAYLTSPSVSVFGPFNVIFRKHWDVLLASVILALLGNGIRAALPDSGGDVSNYFGNLAGNPVALVVSAVQAILFIAIFYFAVMHGRRLSWNRSEWKDFETFQTSEGRWKPWGWASIAIGVLAVLFSILI
jgi:hypothetical protein